MKVYIESMGCDSSVCDANQLRQCLINNGIEVVSDYTLSDWIVLFSCGFNNIRLEQNVERLNEFKRNSDAKIVLAGCISKISPKSKELVECSVGPHGMNKFNELFELKRGIEMFSPKFERGKKQVIRISTGCCGNCSYCAIKIATGIVRSRSKKDIIKDIKRGLLEGVREFVFTAEDTGAWGQDISDSICGLIKEVIKIKGSFRIRITTLNPWWFVKYSDLFVLLNSKKIDKNIYLSIQSGSDRVLKLMNRAYSSLDYVAIFNRLKKEVKGIKIRSDFLVGFPCETEEDFEKTCDIIRKLDFYYVQIFAYTPMDGTEAVKLQSLDKEVIVFRTKKLIQIFLDKNHNEKRPLIQTNIIV